MSAPKGASSSVSVSFEPGPYGRTKKTISHTYTLPKGQSPNLLGSYSYPRETAKYRQLRASVLRLQAKISRVDYENIPGREKAKKKRALACRLSYMQNKLSMEQAALDTVSVHVLEADD